jgi:hypothetical protein
MNILCLSLVFSSRIETSKICYKSINENVIEASNNSIEFLSVQDVESIYDELGNQPLCTKHHEKSFCLGSRDDMESNLEILNKFIGKCTNVIVDDNIIDSLLVDENLNLETDNHNFYMFDNNLTKDFCASINLEEKCAIHNNENFHQENNDSQKGEITISENIDDVSEYLDTFIDQINKSINLNYHQVEDFLGELGAKKEEQDILNILEQFKVDTETKKEEQDIHKERVLKIFYDFDLKQNVQKDMTNRKNEISNDFLIRYLSECTGGIFADNIYREEERIKKPILFNKETNKKNYKEQNNDFISKSLSDKKLLDESYSTLKDNNFSEKTQNSLLISNLEKRKEVCYKITKIRRSYNYQMSNLRKIIKKFQYVLNGENIVPGIPLQKMSDLLDCFKKYEPPGTIGLRFIKDPFNFKRKISFLKSMLLSNDICSSKSIGNEILDMLDRITPTDKRAIQIIKNTKNIVTEILIDLGRMKIIRAKMVEYLNIIPKLADEYFNLLHE